MSKVGQKDVTRLAPPFSLHLPSKTKIFLVILTFSLLCQSKVRSPFFPNTIGFCPRSARIFLLPTRSQFRAENVVRPAFVFGQRSFVNFIVSCTKSSPAAPRLLFLVRPVSIFNPLLHRKGDRATLPDACTSAIRDDRGARAPRSLFAFGDISRGSRYSCLRH